MYVGSITACTGSGYSAFEQVSMGFTGPWAAGITGTVTFEQTGSNLVTMSFPNLLATSTGSGTNTKPITSLAHIPSQFIPALVKNLAVVNQGPSTGTTDGIALLAIGTDGGLSAVDPNGWSAPASVGLLGGSSLILSLDNHYMYSTYNVFNYMDMLHLSYRLYHHYNHQNSLLLLLLMY